jgi:hypothetical protein
MHRQLSLDTLARRSQAPILLKDGRIDPAPGLALCWAQVEVAALDLNEVLDPPDGLVGLGAGRWAKGALR